MKYVKSGSKAEFLLSQGLKLLSHKLIIDNSQLLKSRDFGKETYVPVYENRGSIDNNFKLKPISLLSNKTRQVYINRKEEILNDIIDDQGFQYLQLNWDYNGRAITTISLISKKNRKIIHDDILSNITFTKTDSTEATKLNANQYFQRIQSSG